MEQRKTVSPGENPQAGGLRRHDAAALLAAATAIFRAAGCAAEEAAIVADHLVEASLVGHDSHGIIRVAKYVDWLLAGQVIANRHAEVTLDSGVFLRVSGGFGLGQVIAREAMQLAIARAGETGICVLALSDSGHIGRIGAWAEMAAAAGLVSMHFVNTSGLGILVAPFGGSDRRLSANPIAAGIPRRDGPPIIVDLSTASIAEGKIQVARNKGTALPDGMVLDGAGRPTTDPQAFYAERGAILPFGGHKGYALSLLVEVLAGTLTGGGSSHPKAPTANRLVNNMLAILLRPASLVPDADYAADIERLTGWVLASPPVAPGGRVLLPGDIERQTKAERSAAGIPLDNTTLRDLLATGRRVGADPAALAPLTTA